MSIFIPSILILSIIGLLAIFQPSGDIGLAILLFFGVGFLLVLQIVLLLLYWIRHRKIQDNQYNIGTRYFFILGISIVGLIMLFAIPGYLSFFLADFFPQSALNLDDINYRIFLSIGIVALMIALLLKKVYHKRR